LDIYRKAAAAYKATKYPGPALLIKTLSTRQDYVSIWKELSEGELIVYPIAGDHMNILKEPNLRAWAEKLKSRLIEQLNCKMLTEALTLNSGFRARNCNLKNKDAETDELIILKN